MGKRVYLRGEGAPNATLSTVRAQAILDDKHSDTLANQARKHGVSLTTIWDIQNRRSWRHLRPSKDRK